MRLAVEFRGAYQPTTNGVFPSGPRLLCCQSKAGWYRQSASVLRNLENHKISGSSFLVMRGRDNKSARYSRLLTGEHRKGLSTMNPEVRGQVSRRWIQIAHLMRFGAILFISYYLHGASGNLEVTYFDV